MHILVFVAFFLSLTHYSGQVEVEYQVENKQQCTYFGRDREAKIQRGLVNCSWYVNKACCKTTEVTSVFSTMMPLYGASKACQNQMNYMMCFFCDPDQHTWYNEETGKKVHICADFCRSVYQSCKTAEYEGSDIGDYYQNETAFCQAQNFHLVEGKKNCFNFDPTVFGHTTIPDIDLSFVLGSVLFLMLLRNYFLA